MQTVLITGGSSGIGYTISKRFAKAGFRLLWVSLLEDELSEAKASLQAEFPNCEVETLTQDLSQADGAQKAYDWVQTNAWKIDVLINNAGFGTYGFINEIDIGRELSMIQLNVMNLYRMTRMFLKDMVDRNEGTIINISSNSSFQPTPLLTTYSSTKAFVTHFTRGVAEELRAKKSSVKVLCVCPAAISDTKFKTTNKMDKVKTFDGLATTTAEEVAKDVWRGYSKGKNFVVSGWKMRALYSIIHLIPYRIQQILVQDETKEVA